MEPMILGLSGRKQAGKNTLGNFVLGLQLLKYGIIHDGFEVDERGLFITDLEGDKAYEGVLDLNRQTEVMFKFIEYIAPLVKFYSFADELKRIAISLFGLTYEQCYGREEDKNSLTKIRWEDFANNIRIKYSKDEKVEYVEDRKEFGGAERTASKKKLPRSGLMTAREFLQVYGTDICRAIYDNCWVDATTRSIKEDNTQFAIITDVRFPNEVKGIEDVGGNVVRLTRQITDKDTHLSETALDNYKFKYVIDNANMDFAKQNAAMFLLLSEWNWFPKDGE
jgi:hypothetical protein